MIVGQSVPVCSLSSAEVSLGAWCTSACIAGSHANTTSHPMKTLRKAGTPLWSARCHANSQRFANANPALDQIAHQFIFVSNNQLLTLCQDVV